MTSNGTADAIIDVWVNCPDAETASRLAEELVGARLAAAANIYPPIDSCYRWKGRVERAREVPLLLKTRQSLFDVLAEHIAESHPYETPSITAKTVEHAHRAYRQWLIEQTDG